MESNKASGALQHKVVGQIGYVMTRYCDDQVFCGDKWEIDLNSID